MRPSLLSALLVLAATCSGAVEETPRPILMASARGMASYKPAIRPLLAKALLPDVVVSASPRTGGSLSGGGVVGGDLLLWTGVDISLSSSGVINWSSTALPSGTKDVGFSRPSVGLIKVTNGATGIGVLESGKLTLTSLGTPATPVITQGGAGGATAYSYKVVAKLPDTTTTEASAAGSTAAGNAVLDGTNYNIITWAATTNAHCYDVYRTVGGATSGKIATCTTSPLNDTGLAGDLSTAPTLNSTGGLAGTNIDIGANANASVMIGRGASASATSATAIGNLSSVGAADGTTIGYNARTGTTCTGCISLGNSSAIGNGSNYSVALGYYATVPATLPSTFVSGADNAPISNLYFGDGVTSATPTAYTINGGGASGSDIVGGDLQLAPGISTGAAVPGKVKIRKSRVIGTGSTPQTLADLAYFGDVAADGTTNFFNVTGTLPTTSTSTTTGALIAITGAAGASVQRETALKVTLADGVASPSYAIAGLFDNTSAGAGSSFGVWGQGQATGVVGGGPTNGGAFALAASPDACLFASGSYGAVVADNCAVAQNIFVARDNSAEVYKITDSGAVWAKVGTKTLTESAATSFVLLAISNNSRQGGIIDYCIDADDGTEFQTRCGSIPFAMITKAAVETCTVGTAADAVAVSSSTLTVAFTADTSPANGCYYQANAVSGLTQTTLRINYTVNLYGNAATAVTPQ